MDDGKLDTERVAAFAQAMREVGSTTAVVATAIEALARASRALAGMLPADWECDAGRER